MATLLDLMPQEDWAALEEEIHQHTGANTGVYTPDGFRLTKFVAWANKVCPVIKSDKDSTSAICSTAVQNSLATVTKTKTTALLDCDAGFCRVCVPIYVDGEFLGIVGICGLLLGEDEVENFYVAKLTKRSEEEIAELSKSVPRITKAEADAYAAYLEGKVAGILAKAGKA